MPTKYTPPAAPPGTSTGAVVPLPARYCAACRRPTASRYCGTCRRWHAYLSSVGSIAELR
jgi:hypothetical protein